MCRSSLPLSAIRAAGLLTLAAASGCASAAALPASNSGDVLRVMTYNIHHGADAADIMNLEEIAAVIRGVDPDVVALQEVDRGVERSARRDLLVELAELTGLPHHAFGANIEHQGGDYGNGLLSRYPIVDQRNLLLDQQEPAERRGVLRVALEWGGSEIVVLVTHLAVGSAEERAYSIAQIERQLLEPAGDVPLLLAGDLNEEPGGRVHGRLSARLVDAWGLGRGAGATIPVDDPERRIDYIFHSPHFVVEDAKVPVTAASDHLPVVVELRLVR